MVLYQQMESVARPDGSPVHATTIQRHDDDEDADEGLYLEAASVLGVRIPETLPLVK